MSKTTKIIAALGVVAGLGVAALPAFTFAEGEPSVDGDVDVYVQVDPAIAMTITGNNDDNTYAGTKASYTAVTPVGTENPSQEHWYEKEGDVYTLTADTEVDSGKTYYSLTPGDNAAVHVKYPAGVTEIDSLDVTNFEVGSATKASSVYTHLFPGSSVHGNDGSVSGSDNGFYSTITVYTNNTSGYTLGINGEGTSGALADLVKQYSGTAPADPATIAATGIVKAGEAGWGYSKTVQTDAPDAQTANYQVAANPSLTTRASKTSGGDTTVVYYGVSTEDDQENGLYKATVTYTATCNQ